MSIFDNADFDPALHDLLMKVRKGATASFNSKKTAQLLALFPGWTITQAVKLLPSDEYREIAKATATMMHRDSVLPGRTGEREVSFLASAVRDTTTLRAISFDADEAAVLHANTAKFLVASLPDAKKVKTDDLIVMNLSPVTADTREDRVRPDYVWTFDLFRKVKATVITAPNGQSFDVCGPVQTLGYAGTKTYDHFFKWALANTDLETAVCEKLGLDRHVPAGERPRVPVGGQMIGTCAICSHAQVVRHGVMVDHGYSRPGYGYLVGECFGCRRDPIEISANACVEYIPHLEAAKDRFNVRLTALQTGKVTEFRQSKRNYRTNKDEVIVIKVGDKEFAGVLAHEISGVKQQIEFVTADIATMHDRIKNWTPGTLRHNAG